MGVPFMRLGTIKDQKEILNVNEVLDISMRYLL